MSDLSVDECEALARGLRSGGLHKLQELIVLCRFPSGKHGLRLIFGALQDGSCPNLTKIDLGGTPTNFRDEILALADLLRSRACPQLKDLLLRKINVDTGGLVAVLEALLDGNYSHLTRLQLGRCAERVTQRRWQWLMSYPLGGTLTYRSFSWIYGIYGGDR